MRNQSGYIAITIVLLLSVVVVAVGTTVAYLAIGEGQASLALSKGEENLDLAEGCMEDALINARNSISYASETISRPEGACTITVSKAGTTWTITATPTTTDYRRSVQAVVVRNGYGVTLTSWTEI
ncbi:MAG: hypothetical protein M3Q44_06565 [bacterium]|nr:hypothetical protein [bacterium]